MRKKRDVYQSRNNGELMKVDARTSGGKVNLGLSWIQGCHRLDLS